MALGGGFLPFQLVNHAGPIKLDRQRVEKGGTAEDPQEHLAYLSRKKDERKKVAQLCPTLCDPMDCSPPGSSDHGIFQARILEWVAISFARGSS